MAESNYDKEEVFSKRVRAGKRTYFFDVKTTKGNDYYITITESKKRFEDGNYVKHKIFLYKEDFNRFKDSLDEVINYIKTELMPDYDYEEFDRRQAEWEARRAAEAAEEAAGGGSAESTNSDDSEGGSSDAADEDDMSW